MSNADFFAALENAGTVKDEEIDLSRCALALAAAGQEDLVLESRWHHLQKITQEVGERFGALIENGADDDAHTRLAALKHILADKYDYDGDREHYDNLQNANLAHVIDRRKGMPISLAILYLHAGRVQGWKLEALRFPAHVVCRIDHNGERVLFDPFSQCKILQASDLREYLKVLVGKNAELSASYYESATNRELLIRLQNNVKLRQIEAEEYEAATRTIETMRRIDPDEFRLLFDAGVLYARIGQPLAAIRALENYLDRITEPNDRREALYLLRTIRDGLN
jgi:regulator of sirC expression with transglutaminase-like and TPR domain